MRNIKNFILMGAGIYLLLAALSANAFEYTCVTHDVTKSIQNYQTEHKNNPGSVVAMKNLAVCYMAKGYRKQAQKIINKILALDVNDIDGLVLQGKLNLSREDWNAASKNFTRVIAIDQENIAARKYMSSVLHHLGNTEQAAVEYEKYRALVTKTGTRN